ncbi:MAG: serine--tRNA ligase [Patescibacteria group bacterium]|nr:serine--tRNA ligase [Patescibacteria group bacterium]
MVDIKFVRENIDLMKQVVKNKKINLDVDAFLELDKKRRALIQESEQIKSEQKKMTKEQRDEAIKLKIKFKKLNQELEEIQKKYDKAMLLVPNVYSENTPIGDSDNDNKEIFVSGKIPKFDFPVKDHIELGKELDIIDTQKGAHTSGFRGYYLKNQGALLHFGLMSMALDKLRDKGFVLMVPPTILREFALTGSGHFPEGKDEIYQIANPGKLADGNETKEKFFLAGTSEPSVLAYYANTILEEKDLPIKLAGFSQCYRSEVGSYGKDTKGLYRVHEFLKIEQVIISKADLEQSHILFEELNKNAQEILKDLELPYRVVQVCSGDMGAGKYEMTDIETYMPSKGKYGETHSNSNLTDWQARRLNIKYKTKDNEKKFVYTLNNTMIASPRILIALLENHQQKHGTVLIPKALQKYVGFKKIDKKR